MEEPLIHKQQKLNKREQANCFSRLFFWYVFPTIKRAQKETLQADMVDELEEKERCEFLLQQFKTNFSQTTGKHQLTKAIFKTFQNSIILMVIILTIQVLVQLAVPLLIKETINYIIEKLDPKSTVSTAKGVYLVVGIMLCRLSYTMTNNHTKNLVLKIGYDIMAVLGMAILDKSLKVSFLSNKNHSVGSTITLMTVDAAKLQWTGFYASAVGLLPLQMGIAIYMMFSFIGVSFLAGLAVIFLTIFVNLIISKYSMMYMIASMGCKDARTKCATEIFEQIRFIKINAFENFFLDKLKALREKEVNAIKKRLYMGAANILSVWLSPSLILNSTFALYLLLGNELNPGDTFAIVNIFQILQLPLLALPLSVNALIDANVSIQRVQSFLVEKEIMTDCIQSLNYQTDAISIENGSFSWGRASKKEEAKQPVSASAVAVADEDQFSPVLKNINLKIPKGQFVAFVGDVGSGKSSMLQSIIGEMLYDPQNMPRINISGQIAYVSQTAWIQNATVKENILFGMPFDEHRYQEAIHYSCLEDDIKILVKGDQTMIGEKGVNLSGGQKARVSLARAIYSDKDIFLLDDPISAVDVHVGRFLMQECIKGYLRDKTRILVTHAINFTQFADKIYLMEKGEIVEEGQFNVLKNSPKFEQIYKKFFKEEENSLTDVETAKINVEVVKKTEIKKETPKPTTEAPKDDIDELMLMETREKGTITYNTYFQYIKWNGSLMMLFILFISLIWMAVYMFQGVWMALWTNDTYNLSSYVYLEIYLAAGLTQGLLAFIRTVILSYNGVKAANILHNKMVYTLIYAPICQFFERVPIGQILNRFSKDQNALDADLIQIFSWALVSLSALIANIILTVYSSTAYILIVVAVYIVGAFWLQQVYIKASRELFRLEAMSKSPILSYFSEAVGGLPIIRAYAKQNVFMIKHAQNYDNNRKLALELLNTSVWFGIILGLASLVVNVSALVFCVFVSTKNPGFAGILLTFASTIDLNVQQFVEATTWVETQMVSFERCLAYTKVKPEPAYSRLVAAKLNNEAYQEPQKQGWPSGGEIEYRNYSVRYREGLPLALKNMTIKIESGAKIGVVGRTGAGKSTVTLTLLRILEAAEGSIFVNNFDLSTLSLKQIRESITMIQQDSTIFNGTIRENIDPLKLRKDEEIMEALEQCCLLKFVEERKGLDSQLNQTNMSVGEKQLVCIARAVLRKSNIVLIDEATASIDIETEQTIQDTIKRAFKDCTVITIAHRINTILHCDKILVIDSGTLKEFGSTQELLKNPESTFYGIYQMALKEQRQLI